MSHEDFISTVHCIEIWIQFQQNDSTTVLDDNRRLYLLIDVLLYPDTATLGTEVTLNFSVVDGNAKGKAESYVCYNISVNEWWSYLITGLDCGLDCWTGLMDWITGLNLFISHDLHPIKCRKFGYSKCTSSSHRMLGNVQERTMHKLHGRICIMNSWCTSSELKAPSDYSEYAKSIKNTDKGLFTKNKHTAGVMENAGVKCYTG